MSLRRGALALAVGLLLLPVGLVLHELLHLAVLYPLGDTGRLIVRDWAFSVLPLTLPALHAQVDRPLATVPHLVFDFAGPGLAATAILCSSMFRSLEWTSRRITKPAGPASVSTIQYKQSGLDNCR